MSTADGTASRRLGTLDGPGANGPVGGQSAHVDMSERPVALTQTQALLQGLPRRGPLGRLVGLHPVPSSERAAYASVMAQHDVHAVLSARTGKTITGIDPVDQPFPAQPFPAQRSDDGTDRAGGDDANSADAARRHDGARPDVITRTRSVLICQEGVFAIVHAHLPRAMVLLVKDSALVSGRETDLVAQASEFAADVAARLGSRHEPLTVRPLLVLSGFRHLELRPSPSEVTVLSITGLSEWLERRAPSLTPLRTAELTSAARRPDTWGIPQATLTAPDPRETSRVAAALTDLRAQVRTAARIRIGWVAGVCASLGAAAAVWGF